MGKFGGWIADFFRRLFGFNKPKARKRRSARRRSRKTVWLPKWL